MPYPMDRGHHQLVVRTAAVDGRDQLSDHVRGGGFGWVTDDRTAGNGSGP